VRLQAQRAALVVVSVIVISGCASTNTVDMTEARRVVGTENDVRIDAEVYGDRLAASTTLPIKYDITNHRPHTILIADMIPDATYDQETTTVTITIGSEVPGRLLVPRLIPIAPGEKKTFNTAAHVSIAASASVSPWIRHPNAVRIRLNFLADPAPFQQLIAIKENGVADKELADALFPKWVEGNESVTTNALPMRWAGGSTADAFSPSTGAPVPTSRRGKRGGGS
jgi:hypothetical protein